MTNVITSRHTSRLDIQYCYLDEYFMYESISSVLAFNKLFLYLSGGSGLDKDDLDLDELLFMEMEDEVTGSNNVIIVMACITHGKDLQELVLSEGLGLKVLSVVVLPAGSLEVISTSGLAGLMADDFCKDLINVSNRLSGAPESTEELEVALALMALSELPRGEARGAGSAGWGESALTSTSTLSFSLLLSLASAATFRFRSFSRSRIT